jgi:RHS repeat-associated protein
MNVVYTNTTGIKHAGSILFPGGSVFLCPTLKGGKPEQIHTSKMIFNSPFRAGQKLKINLELCITYFYNTPEISNQTGQLVQRMAYDAWGNRTLLTDNTGTGKFFLDRGYTGHEHLDEFGLINMFSEDYGFANDSATKPLAELIPTQSGNGRLYDPALGRMLSPDPFIQDPLNCQNYNRYSYCLNNPMVYTDPGGYQYNSYYIDGLQVSSNAYYRYMRIQGLSPESRVEMEGFGREFQDMMTNYQAWEKVKRDMEASKTFVFKFRFS